SERSISPADDGKVLDSNRMEYPATRTASGARHENPTYAIPLQPCLIGVSRPSEAILSQVIDTMAQVPPVIAADFRCTGLFNRVLKIAEAHDQPTIRCGEEGHVFPRASQQNPVLDDLNRQSPLKER